MRSIKLPVVATVAALACGAVLWNAPRLRAANSPSTQPVKLAESPAPSTQPSAIVNTHCPVSGDAIDPNVTYVYKGKTYAFCCSDCIKAFKADPEKYAAKAK